jgi:hypothetical protein
MLGDWAVQIGDGTHAIHAEVTTGLMAAKLKITWDGQVLEQGPLWVVLGNVKSFERGGHSFVLSVRGFGTLGNLVLSMDGVEISHGGVATSPERAPVPAPLQFIKELSMQETDELVGTEEYPLDNRFGDQTFTTVRQVSRESTNELSVDTDSHLSGKVGVEVLTAIKAEIEARISQQTGQKIGEKVTESQTLTFSVGPKSSVLYQVMWTRKVRSGERLYLTGGRSVTVPYRMNYGLSCAVRTQDQTATG